MAEGFRGATKREIWLELRDSNQRMLDALRGQRGDEYYAEKRYNEEIRRMNPHIVSMLQTIATSARDTQPERANAAESALQSYVDRVAKEEKLDTTVFDSPGSSAHWSTLGFTQEDSRRLAWANQRDTDVTRASPEQAAVRAVLRNVGDYAKREAAAYAERGTPVIGGPAAIYRDISRTADTFHTLDTKAFDEEASYTAALRSRQMAATLGVDPATATDTVKLVFNALRQAQVPSAKPPEEGKPDVPGRTEPIRIDDALNMTERLLQASKEVTLAGLGSPDRGAPESRDGFLYTVHDLLSRDPRPFKDPKQFADWSSRAARWYGRSNGTLDRVTDELIVGQRILDPAKQAAARDVVATISAAANGLVDPGDAGMESVYAGAEGATGIPVETWKSVASRGELTAAPPPGVARAEADVLKSVGIDPARAPETLRAKARDVAAGERAVAQIIPKGVPQEEAAVIVDGLTRAVAAAPETPATTLTENMASQISTEMLPRLIGMAGNNPQLAAVLVDARAKLDKQIAAARTPSTPIHASPDAAIEYLSGNAQGTEAERKAAASKVRGMVANNDLRVLPGGGNPEDVMLSLGGVRVRAYDVDPKLAERLVQANKTVDTELKTAAAASRYAAPPSPVMPDQTLPQLGAFTGKAAIATERALRQETMQRLLTDGFVKYEGGKLVLDPTVVATRQAAAESAKGISVPTISLGSGKTTYSLGNRDDVAKLLGVLSGSNGDMVAAAIPAAMSAQRIRKEFEDTVAQSVGVDVGTNAVNAALGTSDQALAARRLGLINALTGRSVSAGDPKTQVALANLSQKASQFQELMQYRRERDAEKAQQQAKSEDSRSTNALNQRISAAIRAVIQAKDDPVAMAAATRELERLQNLLAPSKK